MIADQTGALAPLGGAQANTAVLVVDEINASGGVLGREIELILEDSASDDAQAAAQAAKLVQDDRVEVILGGIFSSTRLAIKEPAVEGGTIYIYPEQYEGQEYDPLLFCTGAVPAQQVEPLIPWLMQRTGARRFYLPSADYIWPHVMNRKLHEVASANGGEVVGEQYYPNRARGLGRDVVAEQDQRARRSCSTRRCLPVASRSSGRWAGPDSPLAVASS